MKKVLFVEDDKDTQELWKNTLDSLGVNEIVFISAFSVEEAEREFKNNPDLAAIVMDACVPGREPNTPPFVKEIRNAYKGPIIAVSSVPEFQQMLVEAGCDHMCDKVFLVPTLLKILSSSSV